MEIEIYETQPEGFVVQAEVSAVYVNVEGRVLLLQVGAHKQERGKWGTPAGKLEAGEKPKQAAKRELWEETGIDVGSNNHLCSLGALYIRKPDLNYVYHLFGIQLNKAPPVVLSSEHSSYKWALREEAVALPLMKGALKALDTYYRAAGKKGNRGGVSVNAYLVLRQKNEILFSLRQNTGFCDGYYGLVAGHVEENESATTAMIREAYEEAGIRIHPSALQVVHVMHRYSNRYNIDIFFDCHEWEGPIINREREKCGDLRFFPEDRRPPYMVDYIVDALEAIDNKNLYSEYGWQSPLF